MAKQSEVAEVMTDKLTKMFSDLDDIVLEATLQSIQEVMGIEVPSDAVAKKEKKQQDSLEKELKGLNSKKSEKKETSEGEEEPEEKAPAPEDKQEPQPEAIDPEEKKQEVAEADLESVIEKLNLMRSGQSTKDEEVRDKLNAYYSSLQSGEKQALYSFLDGLTQILTAEIDGKDAPRPSQFDIGVSPTEKEEDTRREKQPEKQKAALAADEDSEPAPIVVGESADKSIVWKRLKEIHR